jgi:hypothetical protein
MRLMTSGAEFLSTVSAGGREARFVHPNEGLQHTKIVRVRVLLRVCGPMHVRIFCVAVCSWQMRYDPSSKGLLLAK